MEKINKKNLNLNINQMNNKGEQDQIQEQQQSFQKQQQQQLQGQQNTNGLIKYNYYADKEEINNYEIKQKQISMITYNVWFENFYFKERNEEIFKILLQYQPDFICLQEVTQGFLYLLQQNQELMKIYYITSNQIKSYGVIILTKHLGNVDLLEYQQTSMGRNLIYIKFKINGQDLVIGTSHLESLDQYSKTRHLQICQIYKTFEKENNVIFMGDFNFDNKKENNNNLQAPYKDAWMVRKEEILGQQSNNQQQQQQLQDLWQEDKMPGFTMKANSIFSEWRPDRIFYKETGNLEPICVHRIGMDPIPYFKQNPPHHQDVVVTPSDHFGLYSEFKVKI